MYGFNWIVFLAVLFSQPYFSPDAVLAGEKILSTVIREDLGQAIKVEKDVQDMRVDWSGQSKAMADELQALTARVAQQEKHLEKINLRLKLEQARLDENFRREKEIDRVEAELEVFLDSVLSRLDSAITADLPFLEEERRGRMADLKMMMVDPQTSSAEKFRRIFEALQIEAEYGITVEVIQTTVALDQVPVLVDLLRVGRVSLLCQTIDRKKSAVFDPCRKVWQVLPEGVNRDIARAISMARLERSIELVKLPLGRIAAQ
ncbi:DUF3450 domain-containing protein [uncultured Desulfobacter sp.]|uniref:DUF3450 domain-containing protein n=1 Tax=uncultured Desulfobacter sp. TaxID=240139 RepID=UPI002AAB8E4F|nr:DUF3450 domain-containing protein [uncultured Desulfobacter sp.]